MIIPCLSLPELLPELHNSVLSNPTQVYLVTGGYHQDKEILSSTELLVHGSSQWVFSEPLPSPRGGLRAATLTLSNQIIVTGKKTCKDVKMWINMEATFQVEPMILTLEVFFMMIFWSGYPQAAPGRRLGSCSKGDLLMQSV